MNQKPSLVMTSRPGTPADNFIQRNLSRLASSSVFTDCVPSYDTPPSIAVRDSGVIHNHSLDTVT